VNAKFEPLIGKPGDGASPHFSITDEYHEHATSEQYDTMLTGMGSREQPMAWVITTAGSDTAGPCYALRSELVDVLEGTVANPEFFGVIYTIDEGVDWTSEEALTMANPNMGVSVFSDFLRSQQRDAVNNPRKQSTFKTKHLNVWVTAASPYFNVEKWNRLGDAGLTIDQFEGEACWLGVDLAAKLDLTAVLWLFRRDVEGADHFYALGRYYLPAAQTSAPENRHYWGWANEGHLTTTPGNLTDYDYVEADIIDSAEKVRVVQIGTDPWNAAQVTTHVQKAGLEAVNVHMTVKNLSEPMKLIQALIEDGRIHHDGNPVLAWAMGNVTAQEDRNDNVFPRKESREKKIDPAVALIIAMGRALADEGPRESKYETGDLLVL
jgi:phage terminase large subunit-like protein